jgi:hypothetical protein
MIIVYLMPPINSGWDALGALVGGLIGLVLAVAVILAMMRWV